MSKWVTEPKRRLPVAADYPVVVVGGGIAGVAAAVAAARAGAKVALIEKTCSLGGLATLANVIVYLPLCDGMGHKVIGGLGEELLKLSVRGERDRIPACWRRGGDRRERLHNRYRVRFDPTSYLLALEELVVRSGVDLWYDTRVCDIIGSGDRINAIVVENKSGRLAVRCRSVVDASGDADVCARAGEPTESLATNTPSGWFFYADDGDVRLEYLHKPFDAYGRTVPDGGKGYAGDDGHDVTGQVLHTRRLIRERLASMRRDRPAGAVAPVLLPTIPAMRMTRRLKGVIELNESDERVAFPDTVGMTGDWRKKGPVYSIPLRALIGPKTPNLIAAGRCISADTIWDLTRAIPTCAVTGEAAGTAAAMAARMRTPCFAKLSVRRLQDRLRQQRVILKKRLPPLAEA